VISPIAVGVTRDRLSAFDSQREIASLFKRKDDGSMKVKISKLQKLATVLIVFPLLAVVSMNSSPMQMSTSARTQVTEPNTATIFKSKCLMCHGAKAEKNFDTVKSDDTLVATVLKGAKPKMPAFEQSLGVDKSKALVTYMRQQRCSVPPPGE
jgi:cytochrome c5